jgi:hypothetical protein
VAHPLYAQAKVALRPVRKVLLTKSTAQSEVSMKHNLRRVGGAVAVAVAAMAVPAFTAAPASAANNVIPPEWRDGCPGCPGPYFKVQSVLDQRVIVVVTHSVEGGVSGLITAGRTKDPVAAKRIRDAAIKTLAGGAAQAGNAAWGADDPDGYDLCPKRKWPIPGPQPQWDQLESQLSQGMTLLGEANRTGSAAIGAQAAKQLDAGAAGLTAFQGCV